MSGDIGLGLATHLKGNLNIARLVGTRIYPESPEQGAVLPFIVYDDGISGESTEHLRGVSGLATTRVQVDAYAARRKEANDLREQIRIACQGFRGGMGEEIVRGCLQVGKHGRYEVPIDKSDSGRYVRSLDLEIVYLETAITSP